MYNLKIRPILVFLTITMLITACGKKNEEQAQISEVEKAQYGIQTEAIKEAGPVQFNAFISGDNVSKKSFMQGAELAISSTPTQSFNLKFLDTSQGSPSTFKSSIGNNNVPVVLYWSVDDISPVAPSLSSSEIVGIITSDVNEKVAALGANVYGFGYSTESTFNQLAKYAGNKLKSYRFAVITHNDPLFELQSDAFIEETKSLGNTIVFEEKLESSSDNFKSILARATSEKCDTIIALLPAPELINFIKSAKSNQYKGKLLVGDSLFASDISTLGQDANGIYMVQAWSDDANLKSKYTSKFGNSPDGITLGYAALGYDLVKCFQEINAPLDAYSIKNSLLSTSCEGITGKTQFTGERIAQRRKVILTVKNGEILKEEQ